MVALGNAILAIIREFVWVTYVGVILFLLPLVAKSRRKGRLPNPPFILCITHVGNFDPLFVVRASGHYRTRAVYQVDGPYPILRFLFKAFWRFRVSQRPELKPILNKKTMNEAVSYLKRGGTLIIAPEGYWHWEKKLYPGVAVMAHRANVPVVPVGIENGDVFGPELRHKPPLRAAKRVIKDYRSLACVTVHFADPIHPSASLDERDDVERLGKLVEARFDEFYRQFYNTSGPLWVG
ncbi:MAG: lysophospholipid acyltransferase family protein [candidate division WOR-3 bacterium]|nr:lysophospholipid acyltransferase family protein [candidate division WOR-3 bacterium]